MSVGQDSNGEIRSAGCAAKARATCGVRNVECAVTVVCVRSRPASTARRSAALDCDEESVGDCDDGCRHMFRRCRAQC